MTTTDLDETPLTDEQIFDTNQLVRNVDPFTNTQPITKRKDVNPGPGSSDTFRQELEARTKTPEQERQERQGLIQKSEASLRDASKNGNDVISEDGVIREREPEKPYAGTRLTLKDSYAIKKAARSAGVSRDDRRSLDRALRNIRNKEASSDDFRTVVGIEKRAERQFEREGALSRDKYGRDIPGTGVTSKVAGADEAATAITRIVNTAAENVRSDIVSGSFGTAQELYDAIESKTGVPGDVVFQHMRDQEIRQLRESGQTSLPGQSPAYPILSKEIEIAKAEDAKAKEDATKVRAGLENEAYEERIKIEQRVKDQAEADSLGFKSIQQYREFKASTPKEEMTAANAAYHRKQVNEGKIPGVKDDGSVSIGEEPKPLAERISTPTENGINRTNINAVDRNINDSLKKINPREVSKSEAVERVAADAVNGQQVSRRSASEYVVPKVENAVDELYKPLENEERNAVRGEWQKKVSYAGDITESLSDQDYTRIFTTGEDGSVVEVAGEEAVAQNIVDLVKEKMSGAMSEDMETELLESRGRSGIPEIDNLYRVILFEKDKFQKQVSADRVAKGRESIGGMKELILPTVEAYGEQGIDAELTSEIRGAEVVFAARNTDGKIIDTGPVLNMPDNEQDRALLSAVNNPDLPPQIRKIVSAAMESSKTTHKVTLGGTNGLQPLTSYDGSAAVALIRNGGVKRLAVPENLLGMVSKDAQSKLYQLSGPVYNAIQNPEFSIAQSVKQSERNGDGNWVNMNERLYDDLLQKNRKTKSEASSDEVVGEVNAIDNISSAFKSMIGGAWGKGSIETDFKNAVFAGTDGSVIAEMLGSTDVDTVKAGFAAAVASFRSRAIAQVMPVAQEKEASIIEAGSDFIKRASEFFAADGQSDEFRKLTDIEKLEASFYTADSFDEAFEMINSVASPARDALSEIENLRKKMDKAGFNTDLEIEKQYAYHKKISERMDAMEEAMAARAAFAWGSGIDLKWQRQRAR